MGKLKCLRGISRGDPVGDCQKFCYFCYLSSAGSA